MLTATLLNDTKRDFGRTKHLGCWATTAGLELLLRGRGIEFGERIASDEVARRGMSLAARAILNPLVVINGEGSIHHDSQRGYFLLELAQAAKAAGCEVWLVNHESRANKIILPLYAGLDYVAARDVASRDELLAAGTPCELSADCSWLLQPSTRVVREPMILACSGTRKPGEMLLRHLEHITGWPIRRCNSFFPAWPDAEAVQPREVYPAFKMFARASLVVSSSYHGCVFAAMHGTPFIWQPTCTAKTQQFAAEVFGEPLWKCQPTLRMDSADFREWYSEADGLDWNEVRARMIARAIRNLPEEAA